MGKARKQRIAARQGGNEEEGGGRRRGFIRRRVREEKPSTAFKDNAQQVEMPSRGRRGRNEQRSDRWQSQNPYAGMSYYQLCRALGKLKKKPKKNAAQIAAVEAEIAKLGPHSKDGGRRSEPKAKGPVGDAVDIIKGEINLFRLKRKYGNGKDRGKGK